MQISEIKKVVALLAVNKDGQRLLVQIRFSIFSRSSARNFSFSGLVLYCNAVKHTLRVYFVEFAVSILLYWMSRKFWIGN